MTRMVTILAVLAAAGVVVPTAVRATEPGFAVKPSATAEGDGVRVRFAAALPCDVEVAILAADGTEVRHLAAGLVGAREAAAPLAPRTLAQSLFWDRKDDRGRPVAGRAFRVRVRLGLRTADARPILKAEKGPTAWSIAGVTTTPDPTDPGVPGLAAEQLTTKEGQALAMAWQYAWRLMADREDDRLYATHEPENTWYRYLGATGKADVFSTGSFLKPGESFRIGPDGEIHVSPLRKLTRDLREVPPLDGVPQREGCNRFNMLLWNRWRAGPFTEHWNSGNRAPEVGLDGRYYIYNALSIPYGYFAVFDTWENKRALHEGWQPWLSYSGKGDSGGDGGHFACVRIDTRGKVYIAATGGPAADTRPERTIPQRLFYNASYGSIVRLNLDDRWADDFPLPMGAPPKDPEEVKKGIQWSSGLFIPRVEKCYSGVMSWLWGGCACKGSIFDLDEYGRLYVPDAGRESVVVLDNAGNEVLRVAKTVADGPESKGTTLCMGWPHRVACTRKAIYFGEDLSRRVIRIGLDHAAEETCDVE